MEEYKKHLENKKKEHLEIIKSDEYRNEVERLRKIVYDFVSVLSNCTLFSSRAKSFQDNCLFIRSIDDILQSAVGIQVLLMEGMNNSARREFRYLLELSIKALYVDQQIPKETYENKLEFLDKRVSNTSISMINDTRIYLIKPESEDDFKLEAKRAYGYSSKYIHPTIHQINERIAQIANGVYVGFETHNEFKIANDELRKIFALILVFAFNAIGGDFTGDMFVGYLDTMKDWEYHKSRFISEIDASYDYKVERKDEIEELNRFRSNTVFY